MTLASRRAGVSYHYVIPTLEGTMSMDLTSYTLAEYRWQREHGLPPARAMATVQAVEQAHLLHAINPAKFERSAAVAAEACALFAVIAQRLRGPAAAYWSAGRLGSVGGSR